MSPDERDALRLWLAAYEPAVDVKVLQEEVEVRSTRPRRSTCSARVTRSGDLYHDLDAALARLVYEMS
jgi:hypothetical protein